MYTIISLGRWSHLPKETPSFPRGDEHISLRRHHHFLGETNISSWGKHEHFPGKMSTSPKGDTIISPRRRQHLPKETWTFPREKPTLN
jgi:hypothetical protein